MTITMITDLGFGDAGKGTIVDALARRSQRPVVVRYNGGAQAAHNVVTDEGRHHTFAQFGAGSFAGAATHLSRFMIVDPLALVAEGRGLQEKGEEDIFTRLTIDENALLATPYQQAANRLRELARGRGRHGSCGMGVGETRFDFIQHGQAVPLVGDLLRPAELRRKLSFVRDLKRELVAGLRAELPESGPDRALAARELALLEDDCFLDDCLNVYGELSRLLTVTDGDRLARLVEAGDDLIFEGAQGVLLDQWFGFHPYTTWSDTTFNNASLLLDEAGYHGRSERLGVLRSYATRHGAGPFPTEAPELRFPERHNGTGLWQESFRLGLLDLVTLRYAIAVCDGVDGIAVTHLDSLPTDSGGTWTVAVGYDNAEVAGIFEEGLLTSPGRQQRPWQEQMTAFIETARPRYETFPVAEFLGLLEKKLGVPVALTSAGPTAAAKRWHRPSVCRGGRLIST